MKCQREGGLLSDDDLNKEICFSFSFVSSLGVTIVIEANYIKLFENNVAIKIASKL